MDFTMSVLTALFKLDEYVNNKVRNGTEFTDIRIDNDIVYKGESVADIVYREGSVSGKRPVIINIHGGGWLVGDKKWRKGLATVYAERGFFVINPNYSLSPATKYPQCVRDLFGISDWLEENSLKYGLDLDRIYMTGDSAGAHLAAVIGAVQSNKEVLEHMGLDIPKHRISRLALFCGVYDYDRCVSKPGAAGLVKEMTGISYGKYKEEFEFYKELSPINYIDENFPPTYFVSAPSDIFCDGQAERLEEKLKSVGTEFRHYRSEDKLATHCFHLNLKRKDSVKAIDGAIEFFNEGYEDKISEITKDSSQH